RLDKPLDAAQVAGELFCESPVLLVAPCGTQPVELAGEGGELLRQTNVEFLQRLRESPQLVRIDDRLGHYVLPVPFSLPLQVYTRRAGRRSAVQRICLNQKNAMRLNV